jgi:hypothetical protein
VGLEAWDWVQVLLLGAVLGAAGEFLTGLFAQLLAADDLNAE